MAVMKLTGWHFVMPGQAGAVYLMSSMIRFVIAVLLLLNAQALTAATLNFNNASSLPALQASGTCGTWNNAWEFNSGEFFCNAPVTFASGDLLRTTSSAVTIRANTGITLNNNSAGTVSNRVNLATNSGTLQINGNMAIYGNVLNGSGSGTIQGTSPSSRITINGTVTSSGSLSLTNVTVTGLIQGGSGAVSLTTVSLTGNIVTSGNLTLNAAAVSGTVNGGGAGSFSNNSSIAGAVTIGNGLTSAGSTFASTVTVTNGTLNTSNSTYSGNVTVNSNITTNNDIFLANVTSTNGSFNLTGGSVTGLISTPCCTLTTNNTNLAGGANVQSGITITGGTIAGDYTMTSANPAVVSNVTMTGGSITSASTVTINNSNLGSDTSPVLVTSISGSVTVNNSQVFGDLITPDYSKVYVNGSSVVTGSCIPDKVPSTACGGVGTVTRDSYWRFDEIVWSGVADEVKDSSLEEQHGRARNSAFVSQLTPSPASCTYGDFQASGSSGHPFVEIARDAYFHNSDEFGFTFWLKMSASAQASGGQTIMAYGGAVGGTAGRFQITRESGGNLRFSVRMTNNSVSYVETSGSTAFNGQWQHIAVSYSKNSRRMRLYLNNQTPVENSSIGNSDAAKTPADGTGNFAIGALPDSTSGIRGQIDEVRFFKRELLAADVKTMYEQAATCVNECFTENFSNNTNWYMTQRNSTPPSLRTAPSRLRLTENSQNQSTSITFKRSFPAAGNKMTIEFDHYSYGGNGADGIALVLSDATVTPVPGSYGGSLGYAQRTNVSPAQSGFAGGWLGIGFDEYGSFSQATEGRVGGTTAKINAIGVRAASSTSYAWLGGTNTLSPILQGTGSTLARGDRYRITIDARILSPQTVSFQLERRLAGGSSYSTLVTSPNLLDLGQPAPPANLLLSYTGSTGDNTNFHEITNVQVCTLKPSTPVEIGNQVHHFELSYANNGVTCAAEEIEVKACADATCSTFAAGSVTATLSANNGATFVGGNSLTFTGSTTVYLKQTSVGDTTLAISGAPNATVCSTANCKITFSNAGLKFYKDKLSTDGLPNQVAAVQGGGYLRAIKTNTDTKACEARTAGNQNVAMFYDCTNPGSCSATVANVLALKDNRPAATTQTLFDGNQEGTVKNVSLNFDAEGYAPLGINYLDVGQLRLFASLSLAADATNPAAVLSGQSDTFVVRPHRINVSTALSASSATNPQTTATGAGFVAAGEAFQLYVSPVNALGNLTPNYGNETQAESVAVQFAGLVYPVSGANGNFSPSLTFSKVATGTYINRFHTTQASWDEVGSISLTASVADGNYLSTGQGAAFNSTPYTVGRFYPSSFKLDSSGLGNSCGNFSYMGQPAIALNYTLSARNLAGTVTTNYSSGYAQKATASLVLEDDPMGAASDLDLSHRMSAAAGSWLNGSMTVSLNNLTFSRLFDSTLADGPGPFFTVKAGVKLDDPLDGRDFADPDKTMNAATAGDCGSLCDAVQLSGTLDVRYGRFALLNAAGPEDEDLPIVLQSQYWDGDRFIKTIADNCSAFTPDNLQVTGVTTDKDGTAGTLELGENPYRYLFIPAPNTPGTAQLEYLIPVNQQQYMRFPWNGGSSFTNPTAEAQFGRFSGNKRQIFWQERLN